MQTLYGQPLFSDDERYARELIMMIKAHTKDRKGAKRILLHPADIEVLKEFLADREGGLVGVPQSLRFDGLPIAVNEHQFWRDSRKSILVETEETK